MLQTVDGVENVYVVDLKTMPRLPITWVRSEEAPYAMALDHVIRTGQITEPGKYGFTLDASAHNLTYKVARIIEP